MLRAAISPLGTSARNERSISWRWAAEIVS
jgi:hypothetical protein